MSESTKLAKIVRQIDRLKTTAIDRNIVNSTLKSTIEAIDLEEKINTKLLLDPAAVDRLWQSELSTPPQLIFAFLRYHHLARPWLRTAADRSALNTQKIIATARTNSCPLPDIKEILPDLELDLSTYWSVSDVFVKILDRAAQARLQWELTDNVVKTKNMLAVNKSIETIASEFSSASAVCTTDKWLAKTKDGGLEIALSKPPQFATAKGKPSTESLSYLIKPNQG